MKRLHVTIAIAALPLAACHKAPDVEYQVMGAEATKPSTSGTVPTPSTASAPKPSGDAARPSPVDRFVRDFGNQDRFEYQGQFRLDRWTGCVADSRSGVAVLNDEGVPECGYAEQVADHG